MTNAPLYAVGRSAAAAWVWAGGVGVTFVLVLVCASAHAAVAHEVSEPPCATCIVFVVDQAALRDLPPALNGIEVLLRPAAEGPAGLQAAIEHVRRAGGRPGLFVTPAAAGALDGPVLAAASRIVLDLRRDAEVDDEVVFRARTVLSELRGASPQAAVGAAAAHAVARELLARGIAPYVDFVVMSGGERRLPAIVPEVGVQLVGVMAPAVSREHLSEIDGRRLLVEVPAHQASAMRAVEDVARAAPWLGDDLTGEGVWDVRCGGRRQPTYLDPVTLDTIAVVSGCSDGEMAIEGGADVSARARLSTGIVLLRIPAGEAVFAEGLQVLGERTLGVEEIVARHQAAAARQRRLVQTLVSSGSMTLTFEAPGFPAPLTITSETVIYARPDRTDLEQREIRVNGIAFSGRGVPRLPLIEPERVASPPLAIVLTDVYRYRLAGEEDVDGTPCYVVVFEPLDRRASLFAGRAWIARDSFALVRVAAAQTNLRGPIVASEQIETFRRGREGLWLLARSDVRQLYEGAGHRTPIHRVLTLVEHEINAPRFEERLQAAYAAPSVMLRETAEGFRYLERDRSAGPRGDTRLVAGRAASVRTLVAGAVFDPNIDRPLPFAGVSYVHFDLFGTGGQLSAFFGGTYGQLAVSLPSVAGTRWQVGARAFGIASAYNDRAFVEGREVYAANISQRPAQASAWLLRPVGRRLALRAGYGLDYTHFAPADSTSPSFTIPAAQVAHGVNLALQGQWAGLDGSLWWTGAARTGWRAWGEAQDTTRALGLERFDARHRTYQRYGMSLGRSWIASPTFVGRVEAAWMDGRDLDRFSRYTFGTFDNRLRGYPAALIRYDRGAVLRTATAWAVAPVLRVDGFVDVAFVRDPGFGGDSKRYAGIGLAVEAPGPLGTLVGVEWGYGFQGINADGRRGTQVLRVSGYKMF